jgi:hypothetical protein
VDSRRNYTHHASQIGVISQHSRLFRQALTELRVLYCTNFGDREVRVITNLLSLKSFELRSGNISREGWDTLRQMKQLTNAIILPIPQ